MFHLLGRLTCRHPWLFVLAAVLLVFLSGWQGRDVMDRLSPDPGWEVPTSGSALARQTLSHELGRDETPVILLFRARPGRPAEVDHPEFRAAVEGVLATLARNPEVLGMESYYASGDTSMRSADGRMTFALVRLARGPDEGMGAYQRLRDGVASDVLEVSLGGELATYSDLRQLLERDLWRAEVISFILLAPLLLLVFGSAVAALLPLVIGGVTVLVSMALLSLFSRQVEISLYAANVVSMLGLGLGIDYGLFIVSRFREELTRQGDTAAAVRATLASAGHTVAFSGLTVAASLFCLFLLPQRFFQNMGLAGGISVGTAMLTATLLLPALLALLGPRVNQLTPAFLVHWQHHPLGRRFWAHFSRFVMGRAVWLLPAALLLLGAMGSPMLDMRIGPADSRTLPPAAESRLVQDTLETAFPHAALSPLVLTVETRGDATSAAGIAALHALSGQLKALPGINRVTGLASLDDSLSLENHQMLYANPAVFPMAGEALARFAKGHHSLIYVHYSAPPNSEAARDLVRRIRALPAVAGIETVHVGGYPAEHVDYVDSLKAGVPWVVAAIVSVILVLLFLMLGSVVLPIKAVLTNLLSLSATFGGLVWIFQEGHLADLLGFTPQGQLEGTVLVLIFASAFGLSIDYEVFLLSRVREMRDRTGDTVAAIAEGIQRSGPVITRAALLIGVVLGTFAMGEVVFMKAMGLGLLLSVMVDATLVRMLLVPASLKLLGRYNWWAPRPLVLLYERLNPHDSRPPPS